MLLACRLLVISFLVLAFAQPFIANSSALKQKELVIYLDDSYSMQARKGGQTLLEIAKQDLVQHLPKDLQVTIFTNSLVFKNVTLDKIQNRILELKPSSSQLSAASIALKSKNLFSNQEAVVRDFMMISDFQENMGNIENDSLINTHAIQLQPDNSTNLAIDSIAIDDSEDNNLNLQVFASGFTDETPVSLALYNGEKPIAKSSIKATPETNKGATNITLPKGEQILGELVLDDNGLTFDNTFYFSIDKLPKIKVLAIGNTSNYLDRIFTEDEFEFTEVSLNQLNYSDIPKQNLIVVNELEQLPKSLSTVLTAFVTDGGSLTFIPNPEGDISSYNALLNAVSGINYNELIKQPNEIAIVADEHPLFKGCVY